MRSIRLFDKDGKYLYFTASTDTSLRTGWLDMSSLNRPVTRSVYVMVLRKDAASPLAPESDEEKPGEARRRDKEKDADRRTRPRSREGGEARLGPDRPGQHRPAYSGASHSGSQLHGAPVEESRRALSRRGPRGRSDLTSTETGLHRSCTCSISRRARPRRFSKGSTRSTCRSTARRCCTSRRDQWFIVPRAEADGCAAQARRGRPAQAR